MSERPIPIGQYQTAFAPDVEELGVKVNALIVDDWQPYGSPYVKGDFVCQAMVKPAKGAW
jgi:hypothetical protein